MFIFGSQIITMNPKHKIFADAYVANRRNGSKAAIQAGYSVNAAKETAYKILQHDEVQEYIKKEFAKVYERNKGSIDEAVSLLMDIARTNANDLFNEDGSPKRLDEIPVHAIEAIEEIETATEYVWDDMLEKRVPVRYIKKMKASGKKAALVEILKVMGGYKLDNDQKKPEPIVLNINPLGNAAEVVGDDLG